MTQEKNDVCKEILTVLAYFDNDLIKKIPDKVFKELVELSADSDADFYIDIQKNLDEQDLSEECKDLVSLIYYEYIANDDEKNNLFKLWNYNENKYQEKLLEKYNIDNIFQNKAKEIYQNEELSLYETAMIEYKKENIFDKIKKLLKKIINFTK